MHFLTSNKITRSFFLGRTKHQLIDNVSGSMDPLHGWMCTVHPSSSTQTRRGHRLEIQAFHMKSESEMFALLPRTDSSLALRVCQEIGCRSIFEKKKNFSAERIFQDSTNQCSGKGLHSGKTRIMTGGKYCECCISCYQQPQMLRKIEAHTHPV